MTPERWRQVTEVFHAARARDAAVRASYLKHACAGDGALRALKRLGSDRWLLAKGSPLISRP